MGGLGGSCAAARKRRNVDGQSATVQCRILCSGTSLSFSTKQVRGPPTSAKNGPIRTWRYDESVGSGETGTGERGERYMEIAPWRDGRGDPDCISYPN